MNSNGYLGRTVFTTFKASLDWKRDRPCISRGGGDIAKSARVNETEICTKCDTHIRTLGAARLKCG